MDCSELNLIRLQLTVHAENPAYLLRHLPLAGGRFTALCRDLVCTRPVASCRDCRHADGCGWHLLFAQELATDPVELKRHQKPPLPFVFSFPEADDADSTEDDFVIGLVVAGTAINHLALLLEGVARLLGEMSARLVAGASCDYQGTALPFCSRDGRILHPQNLIVLSAAGVLESRSYSSHLLQVELLSPLRLFDAGHLRQVFDFGPFARSLMRRISAIAYYYGDCSYDLDFGMLARQANEVVCRKYRFSFAVPGDRRLSGIRGSGEFEGSFSAIMPFLVLGQLLHVGKAASFGFGDYCLQAEP